MQDLQPTGESQPGERPPAGRAHGLAALAASLAAIVLGTAAWFAVFAACIYAAAFLYDGLSGLNGLLERYKDIEPARDPADATVQRVMFAGGALIYLSALASILTVARLTAGRGAADLLGWRGPWPAITRAGWLLIAAAPIYHIAAGAALRSFYPDFALWLIPAGDVFALLFSFAMIVVLAPLTEELLFRGLIFGALRARFSASFAILASAFAFAIVHWDQTGLYPVAVLAPGLALSVIRERTGSAKGAVLGHAIYNFVGWVLLAFAGPLLLR